MRSYSTSISLIALVLALSHQLAYSQNVASAAADGGNFGGLVGGLTNQLGINQLTGNLMNGPMNLVNNVARGPMSSIGSMLGGNGRALGMPIPGQKFNEISEHPLSDSISLSSGMLEGLVSGTAAATGLGSVSRTQTGAMMDDAAAAAGAARAGTMLLGGRAMSPIGGLMAARAVNNAANIAGAAVTSGAEMAPATYMYSGLGAGARIAAGEQAAAMAAGATTAINARNAAATGAAAAAAATANEVDTAATIGATDAAVAATSGALAPQVLANQVVNRQALAADALANANAESAIAGADMVAHGANNARSASLASNAYRQAKLASARDRVNIAGTIQNSARISDAAIATHDAATKAEDSLLGSELAVDSAATVLDSDAAYIPPVTNSLLRSLPYGRLGLRNIIPKPLTYPGVLLPDVWLNGRPVNYLSVPFRALPYGIGPAAVANPSMGPPSSSFVVPNGLMYNGQPFHSNNGILIDGMVVDPSLVLVNNRFVGSSIFPILANGQLEAQDEIAMAHATALQQQAGSGQLTTYNGFGRMNSVPMLTGSVSDANLSPTTTIGTTYPIGSTLVVEPRDSYFQDYVDNASSRQNFDERQQ